MADPIVLSQLKQKREEILRGVRELEAKLREARTDLGTINSTLRIFGEEAGEPRAYSNRAKLFQAGELSRTIYDALRDAPNGLDSAELAEIAMRSKGYDREDKALRAKEKHSVCNALVRYGRDGKIQAGEIRRGIRVWRRAT